MSWFYCTYHCNACQVNKDGELRCKDGDESHGGHCTCVGPFGSRAEAEESEHARLKEGREPESGTQHN